MDNTEQPSPEVKLHLNETLVLDWLRARAAQAGIPGLTLKIDSTTYKPCIASINEPVRVITFGYTFEEAIAELRLQHKSPEEIAQQKRAQAAKLIAEADALTSGGKVVSA